MITYSLYQPVQAVAGGTLPGRGLFAEGARLGLGADTGGARPRDRVDSGYGLLTAAAVALACPGSGI